MIHRFAVRRRECAAVAGRTLVDNGQLGVIPLGRLPGGRTVAAHTVHAGGDVRGRFTCRGAPVVATRTVRSRGEQAVIGFGAEPRAGRFMAAFTNRLAIVNSGRRPACCPITGAHVAGRALRGHRYVGVELPWVPAGVAPFMATVTVGDRNTT